jgi:pimeloyl-ACP methyl ester carboxylesterase/DNA-binding CsgD family transcriptional regulator
VDQEIRFATAPDGVRIAYAVHGSGPPLVRAAHWLTHLEHDWRTPVWRHWLEALGRSFRLIRYDERGCGLSDREIGAPHLDDFVGDLEVVVDAVGLESFDLLGTSQGGAIAVAYAARHPERVRRLVLYGAYARGRLRRGQPAAADEADLLHDLIRHGWGRPNPAFRRVFSTLFTPDAGPEHLAALDELMRVSLTGEEAIRLRQAFDEVDVTDPAGRVRAPTIVIHPRDDGIVPFEEGRLLATLIPGARFEPLDGRNHLMLEAEPAWARFVELVRSFLGVEAPGAAATGADDDRAMDALSDREREILALVAAGRSNVEIAEALVISPRTVERHLSNVYDKLGVTGKAARAAAAARHARR